MPVFSPITYSQDGELLNTNADSVANAVATALAYEYADMEPIKYFAMDISLYDKNGNQVTNLICKILLADRIVYQAHLHVVANHGTGDWCTSQWGQALIDVLGRLFQIESHIRKLMKFW